MLGKIFRSKETIHRSKTTRIIDRGETSLIATEWSDFLLGPNKETRKKQKAKAMDIYHAGHGLPTDKAYDAMVTVGWINWHDPLVCDAGAEEYDMIMQMQEMVDGL